MSTEKKIPFLVLTFFLAMSLVKFSTLKANEVQAQEMNLLEDRLVTEVFFSEGKKQLSNMTRHELVKNYYLAHQNGKVVEAKIFSWGDKGFETSTKFKFKKMMKIVEDRNDTIESILEEIDLQLPVRKYNLAEREDILLRLTPEKDREMLQSLRKFNDYYSRSIVYFVVK